MGDDAAEAAEAQALMNKLGIDYDVAGDDDDEEEEMDPEEILEKFRRDIDIDPDNCLDQVILGTSNIEAGVAKFKEMSSVEPCIATKMRGSGVTTARCAFEECAFVEIIAPDPNQDENEFTKKLKAIPEGELVPIHYAVRSQEAKELEKRREWKDKHGMECDQITMVSKDRGMPWFWDMYIIKGDGLVPFLTDYAAHDSKHPCSKLPICGTLGKVTVSAPDDHCVHKLLKDAVNVNLSSGSPKLEFTIACKNGASHTFSSSDPCGVSFPETGGIGS